MQLEVVIYIYILSSNAQASFTPQGTSESTGEKISLKKAQAKIQAKVSCISLSLARDKELGFCWKLLFITLV